MAAPLRLGLIIQAIDKASAPLRRIGQAVDRVARQTGLNKVGMAAARVGRQMKTIGREAAVFGRRFGIAILAAGAGMFALTRKFANAGDELAKTADRIGIGIEELQEFQHAFQIGGVEVSNTNRALGYFVRTIGDAARGTGEGKDTFDALGISIYDAAGKIRPTRDLLEEVADKMAQQTSEAKKAIAAQRLFGRGGLAMVNALGEGSAALRKHGDEARRLGLITEADARASEQFNDNLTRMIAAVRGVGYAIAGSLLPVFEPTVNALREWAVANREELSMSFRRGVRDFGDGLKDLWAALKDVVQIGQEWSAWLGNTFPPLRMVGHAVKEWADQVGYLKIGLGVVAAFMGSKLIAAIIGLVAPLVQLVYYTGLFILKGAALLLTLNPLVLGALALAAAGLAIYNNWFGLGDLLSGIIDKARWAVDRVNDALGTNSANLRAASGFTPPSVSMANANLRDAASPSGGLAAGAGRGSNLRVGGSVAVKFDNMPREARVTNVTSDNDDVPLDVRAGYAMGN